ncbi:FMN-binding negative transcriptional regulator [Hyphomonas beringensis]|nr:FMN-binding negative transcriptional regulator [Hyphomonas beringensis]
MSSAFETVPNSQIVDFAAVHPLAWIVPVGDPSAATLMPLLLETDAQGMPVSLLGHLPKSTLAASVLTEQPEIVCLFLGPNAYISPDWVSKPDWAPTWNFVSLKISGQLVLDEALTDEAIRSLVAHMNGLTGANWDIAAMGERYTSLLKGITGFRIRISSVLPRFKVGQDENSVTYSEIYDALTGHALQDWMR